jgi:glycosyltransferase involved in cell wall biosynthesis
MPAMPGLRFGMLTTFYPPYNFGGDGIGVQRLARGLVRRGHQVTVIQVTDAYRALTGGADPPPEDAIPDGVEVVRLGSRTPRLATLLAHQTGGAGPHRRALERLLVNGRFDVLNFHNLSLAGGPWALGRGDALKVYMAHEHWLVCPTHVLWRHRREACSGRQCLRCVLHYRRPPQLWRYTRKLERNLRHVDAFIAMSRFSRDKHREFGFEAPMEVVGYFLPDELPAPPAAGEASPHPRPYFLYVGRLERLKGVDDVLPVFRDYAAADLLIAGDGEDGARLRAEAREIPGVRFLGHCTQTRLETLYRHAVALIVPSVGIETFGIILIEAFRQRLPVVARAFGPFPEIVGEAGLLFRDRGELLAAMRSLQGDPEHRERLAEAGLESFRRRWCESAMMPRYLQVVREAAERTGRDEVAAALAGGE